MAWAERATVIIGLFWALFVFMMMGGAPWLRPDLSLGMYLWIFALCEAIPLLFVWIILRLIFGDRGSAARY